MIFGGASTFSKMHCNYPENIPESVIGCCGQGLVNDNRDSFFDTVSALGSRLIDYRDDGGMMSLPHQNELTLARMLSYHFPFIEMVRYGCNGADATEGAIRYARANTGKKYVVSYGYHSCQSAFTMNTPPALGCVFGHIVQANSLDSVIKLLKGVDSDLVKNTDGIAAVIVEPVILDLDVREKLSEIRMITKEKKIILIFDEIITGFRVPTRSISTWFKIIPDLILLGKAMGGGYPLSIIGGTRSIMDVPVFHSYTFSGLPKALKNAIEICGIGEYAFQHFWENSLSFMNNFNSLKFDIKLTGYATRGVWTGPDELKYTFWQEMYKKGILLGPAFFPRIKWLQADYDMLINTSYQILNEIREKNIKLDGRMPNPIFKRN